MIRLILGKKRKTAPAKSDQDQKKIARQRNRRIFERYNVNHKHLTMLNEQDMLVVREISAKGFSTYVPKRSCERFSIGDVYEARMRHLGETYQLEAKVSWKEKDIVGFELTNTTPEMLSFLQRLLKPIEIAESLRAINTEFLNHLDRGRMWFHGDENTDLYIWNDDAENIIAWQLIMKDKYIEWSLKRGPATGSIRTPEDGKGILNLAAEAPVQVVDVVLNERTKQFAIDILLALQLPEKDLILPTILE